jgi:hypothetical protein
MWVYQKMLQYPAGTVSTCNPKLAKDIITQYGGPDGELAASLRYLTQRYTMPIPEAKAALTDIGTEESVPRAYKYGGFIPQESAYSPHRVMNADSSYISLSAPGRIVASWSSTSSPYADARAAM